jgi:hypothetical protein
MLLLVTHDLKDITEEQNQDIHYEIFLKLLY